MELSRLLRTALAALSSMVIRSKRDSSIRVASRLVREGVADGVVSAGNTGAAMATAKMIQGMIPGVDRPALASDGFGGAVLHGDPLAGVTDLDVQIAPVLVGRQLLAEHIFVSHQDDMDSQRARRPERSFDFRLGGVIAAHCVNRDSHHAL